MNSRAGRRPSAAFIGRPFRAPMDMTGRVLRGRRSSGRAALVLVGGFLVASAGPGPTPSSAPGTGGDAAPGQPGGPPASPGTPYTFEFRPRPGETLYYVIENEFRDSGGVPPLLSFSASIRDKRYITQRVLPTSQPGAGAQIEWECDRYEARETGMKGEAVFDSLRHLYPPPDLHSLGGIPGSRCTFALDRAGRTTDLRITPAAHSGPPGRGRASQTSEKCQLNPENLTRLLDALGPFYLPKRPVALGEQWVGTVAEPQRTFGTARTTVRCTFARVRQVEGRPIATIEISGQTALTPATQAAHAPPPTSRPGQSQPAAASAPREFRIEKAFCGGTAEFDLIRGELVRLDLLRELAVAADIEGNKTFGPMKLKSGSAHHLKVSTSRRQPPRPVIVGGKKPPPMPPEEHPRTALAVSRPTVAPASRPATTAAAPAHRAAPLPQARGQRAAQAPPPPAKRIPGRQYEPSPEPQERHRSVLRGRPATTLPYLPPAGHRARMGPTPGPPATQPAKD